MREKLIELLGKIQDSGVIDIPAGFGSTYKWVPNTDVADQLIAGGVTVQQWIPVEERRPDLIPCSAGTGYSEAVNVLTSGRKVLTAIWDGSGFIADADFWDAEGEEITHWTPVFLPLPQPPKEG